MLHVSPKKMSFLQFSNQTETVKKVKVKLSNYRPGEGLRAAGG